MDVLSLNAKITELEETKANLDRQNQQLRHDAAEYDTERRGLLDFLDDSKLQVRDYEKALEIERTRKNELEATLNANAEQFGMELKFVRRELQEKNLRLKVNTLYTCMWFYVLLEIGEDEYEIGL